MKAYELMIFNFVYENGEILLLDKWEFKGHVIDDECKNLVPIPLDESWLKDFGFEKKNEKKWLADVWTKGTNPLTEDYLIMIKCIEGNYFYETTFCTIKYVHQLQNLYFALTKKELKYKS